MDEFDPYARVKMGTTLVGLRYKGGVIVASDTRTSSGNFISDRFALKSNQISPSPLNFGHIYVERCGDAAHTQMLTRYVYNYLNFHVMELEENANLNLKTVTNLYKNICYSNKDSLSCAFILSNGKELSSINTSGAYFFHDLWTSHGSGSAFIDGYLRNHTKANMTFEEAHFVITKSIALAIAADSSSGGCIRVVNIRDDGTADHNYIDNAMIEQIIES
jgi:20S proteasome subunit beta 1